MADDHEETTPYVQYMYSIYEKAMLMGQLPPVTTNPALLETQARKVMSEKAFNYIYGAAGEMSTAEANRLAFRQWQLIPKFLQPVTPRDLRVELFGHKYGMSLTISMDTKDPYVAK